MLPACATETNRQMRFSFSQMGRQQHQQEPRDTIHKFEKSGIIADIAGDFEIAPILLPQSGVPIGIS
jgi:hypothetical protein